MYKVLSCVIILGLQATLGIDFFNGLGFRALLSLKLLLGNVIPRARGCVVTPSPEAG